MRKVKARFLGLKVECSGETYEVDIEMVSWYASDHECDLCGSHGSVELSFTCGCGETHDLELTSW